MSEIKLHDFERIARTKANTAIYVDMESGNLKTRNNSFFNRVVNWFQGKLGRSPDPLRQDTEKHTAYNAFLRAIGENCNYDNADINWAEGNLGTDVKLGRALSSRRVKEIMQGLEGRVLPSSRNNRVTALFMSGREGSANLSRAIQSKIEERPNLQKAGYQMSAAYQEQLSQKVYDAIIEKGNDGRRTVDFNEGREIVNQCVDEMLETLEAEFVRSKAERENQPAADMEDTSVMLEKEAPSENLAALSQRMYKVEIRDRKEVEQKLKVAEGITSEADVAEVVNQHTAGWVAKNRLQDWYSEAVSDEMQGAQVPQRLQEKVKQTLEAHKEIVPYKQAKMEVRAIVKDYVERHDAGSLDMQLREAGLPSEVHEQVTGLIKNGKIIDKSSLAKQANQCLAEWTGTNRVGKWYRETLEAGGVELDQALLIPAKLTQEVTETINDHPQLWSYDDMKVQARRVVQTYAQQNDIGEPV